MIQSFDDAATEDIYNGTNSKAARAFDKRLWPVIVRKLDRLDAAASLEDLKEPPSNKLHALKKDQAGRYAIWVNAQFRITFRFADGNAYEVRCEDYH